ncbi:DUF6622 family protein [Undibacterium oligocarboniphilum]
MHCSRQPTKGGTMLQQILTHTPVWVWVLLGFLIYRGIKASQDREMSFWALTIIPVVMLLLSLQGLIQHFGLQLQLLGPWMLSLLLTGALAMKYSTPDSIRILPAKIVFLKGSWLPLILMLSIFTLKYAENILIIMQPALRGDLIFTLVCSIVFGITNGLFFGKVFAAFYLLSQKDGMQAA